MSNLEMLLSMTLVVIVALYIKRGRKLEASREQNLKTALQLTHIETELMRVSTFFEYVESYAPLTPHIIEGMTIGLEASAKSCQEANDRYGNMLRSDALRGLSLDKHEETIRSLRAQRDAAELSFSRRISIVTNFIEINQKRKWIADLLPSFSTTWQSYTKR